MNNSSVTAEAMDTCHAAHHVVELKFPAMKQGNWVSFGGYNYKIKSTMLRGMDLYLHLHGEEQPVHADKVQAEHKAVRLRMRKQSQLAR